MREPPKMPMPISDEDVELHEQLAALNNLAAWMKEAVEEAQATQRPSVDATLPTCTRCDDPIVDGYMIGDGDGSGQRFAHPECYRLYPGAYKYRVVEVPL